MPQRNTGRSTTSRKKQHVDLTLTKNVSFKAKTTGLEHLEFVHNALPELNFSDVNTSTRFLNRTLKLPFMVSCMTGGYPEALAINRQIAEVCQDAEIAMGVGSQRQAMEDSRYHRTFSVVREAAPSIPIVGNLGGAEVARMVNSDSAKRLVDLIRADAFTVHLNPLQELLQPEGNTDFRGVLQGIARLVKELPVPVIVKEIGAGISADAARRLLDVGVRYIDVAGSGGTSWAGVESFRSDDQRFASHFWDWGIPTAQAIKAAAPLKSHYAHFTLIASGGIGSGIDAAKCIVLGADIAASARPMLKALHQRKQRGLRELIDSWGRELRSVMFLTGSATIADLRHTPLVGSGIP